MTEPPTRQAALVTGGAVRLGKAIALALAAAGYDIALHFHSSANAAAETAAEIRQLGVRCELFSADLRQPEQIDNLLPQAAAVFPHLHAQINSASAYAQAAIMDTTPALFDQQFTLNLRAPFFLTQAFARHVGQGCVINIIDNKIGFNQYQYAAYLLAKKGLAEFTRMAALELAPAVRVNGVAPGVVLPAKTRSQAYIQWRIQGIPLRRQGTSHHITQAILSLLQNEFITGQVLVVDGGESITNAGQNAGDYDQSQV